METEPRGSRRIAVVFQSRYPRDFANAVRTGTSEPPKPVHRTSTSSKCTEAPTTTVPEAKNVPSWLDQSVVSSSSSKSRYNTAADVGMGYTLYLPEAEDASQPVDFMSFPSELKEMVPSLEYQPPSQEDPFDIMHVEIPESFSIPCSLSPPITYSFQETSIARRIHRSCAESGYHIISDPRSRPAEYERIFRLSLMGRDRAKIAASLKNILDRGPHEDLDFWEAPLIHVGGAGTHYPRRDPYGNIVPRKSSFNIGKIGPQTLALLENASRDNLSTDMTVELAGFEGEWFDPYDVQGYLEEKGIFIDPTSSFAEAEIVELPGTSSNASIAGSFANPQTPPSTLASPGRSTPLTGHQVKRLVNDFEADLSQWNDFTNIQLSVVGYSDAQSGSWMNFVQPGQSITNSIPQHSQTVSSGGTSVDFLQDKSDMTVMSNSQPASPQPRRKSIIIDVSKFVKGE